MRVSTLLSNTGFNLAGMTVTSLLALVLTPWLIRGLGAETFGVWALFGVVMALAQMLDFGLGRALVRTIAHHKALGQWSAVAEALNSVLWPLLALALLLSLAALVMAFRWVNLLGVPAARVAAVVPAFRLLGLSFAPIVLSLVLAAVVEGCQRMAYTNIALIANRLVFAVITLAALSLDWGLTGVAAAALLGVVVQAGLLLAAVRRVAPALRFSPRLCQSRLLQREWRFGRFLFLTSLIALGFTAGNKFILARWVGLTALGYYELVVTIATQIFTLALAMAQALYPAYVGALAEGGPAAMRRLYGHALRLALLVLAPITVVVVALATPFTLAWLGRPVSEVILGLQWLTTGWAFVGLAAMASIGLQALGRPGWAAVFSFYNLTVNLVLAMLWVPVWGYDGLIAANVLAITSSAALTQLVFGRAVGVSPASWLATLSPRLLAWPAMLGGLLAWLGGRWQQPHIPGLLLLGGGFLLVYAVGLWVLGLLRPEETAWLQRQVRRRSGYQGVMP
ncbi:MAG: oligosaccharide flippase family protein [Caldilineales bacterium]|nr:oligosaccharide flippase family protein [Caldilineales bacterium]